MLARGGRRTPLCAVGTSAKVIAGNLGRGGQCQQGRVKLLATLSKNYGLTVDEIRQLVPI